MPRETIIKLSITGQIATSLISGEPKPRTDTPKSAYDTLVNKSGDYDGDALAISAVFDAMGFNTAIIAGKNYADVIIQIDDKWWGYVSGTYVEYDIDYMISNGGRVAYQPTYGPSI
ncbi:hypothetical protein D3C76_656870 [compost metagenome]